MLKRNFRAELTSALDALEDSYDLLLSFNEIRIVTDVMEMILNDLKIVTNLIIELQCLSNNGNREAQLIEREFNPRFTRSFVRITAGNYHAGRVVGQFEDFLDADPRFLPQA